MVKKFCLIGFTLLITLSIILFKSSCGQNILAQSSPTITSIGIGPTNLDISRFSSYYATAQIENYSTTSPVSIEINGINGDVGTTCWNYYADGTCGSSNLTYDMTYDSGTTWTKTNIRPDHIYPQIYMAPSSITWYNEPVNTIVARNNYQLLHFQNPFTSTNDMNFWIELNTSPIAANSADLHIYLVSKNLDSFTSDWRNNANVELVGSITASTSTNHTHTSTSSHYLIALTANADGTFGTKNLDISGDFWIIIYNTSPNNNRGWNLRYQITCSHADNRWYKGNQSGWTTTAQTGCPNAHVHFARRGAIKDGVNFTVTAESVSSSQQFYFNELPNLPPNATNFTTPVIGSGYSGTFNISWNPASDPNDDTLTYKINLLDNNYGQVAVLSSGTTATSLSFNSTLYTDGDYSLSGQVCDPSNSCTNFSLGDLFNINNTVPLRTLSSISIASNNANPQTALTGDNITLTFISSGSLASPIVNFYSNGYPVTNSITTTNPSANNWQSVFVVGVGDTNGTITFTIDDSNLSLRYYDTTDSSQVSINNPLPTSTPTPTPTPTLTPTPLDSPTSTPTPAIVLTNRSVSSTSSPGPFVCQDTTPVSAPNLFQIDITNSKAKLYFTPIANIDTYYISFSTNPNAEQYGEQVSLLKEGVQSHTVYYLSPSTNYYFKVRAQNGCMPGPWSNIMTASTNLKKFIKPSIFYQSNKSNKVVSPKPVSLTTSNTILIKKPTQKSPTQTPIPVSPSPTPLPKKHCFLWWCW